MYTESLKNDTSANSTDKSRTPNYVNFLPAATFIISLILTLFVWYQFDNSLMARSQAIYADKADEISGRIILRMHDHEQVLRGAAGLFSVKETVTRTDWRHYVSALQLDERHPGILGIGFSKWLTAAEKDANIKEVRSEGFPEYTIRPEGERPVYTSIIFLEPFNWRNQRAFGYDMYTEPVRKAALDKARDENVATIAAKIILLQETDKDKQSGMLMYVPVYRQGMHLDTVENRRKAFIGFAYSPIRMNDFVSCTLTKVPLDIAFDLNVIGGKTTDTLMFSSIAEQKLTLPKTYTPAFTSTKTVEAYGSSWQFTFKTLPGFNKELNRDKSYIVFCSGIAFSILLTYIVLLVMKNRTQAIKHGDEKLFMVKSQLSSVVESSGDIIAIMDTEYRYTSFNSAFHEEFKNIFGKELKPGDSMLQALEDFPGDLVNGKAYWDQAFRGDDFIISQQFGDSKLTRNWYELHFSPVRDAEGKVIGAVHIVRNITERKQAEELLKESEERFKAMFLAHSAIMLLVKPDDFSLVDANLSAEKFYGYSHEALLNMKIHDINILPQGTITTALHNAEASQRTEFIFNHRLASGEVRIVEVHTTPIEFGNSKLLFSIIHDITDRVENEENYHAIFNHAAVGIARLKAPGRYVEVNDRLCDMLGYTREELLSKTFQEITHPDDVQRDTELVKKAIERTGSPSFSVEKRYLCKSGAYRWAQTTLTVTHHQDGSPNVGIAVIADIQQIKQAEESLQKLSYEQAIILENAGVGISYVCNRHQKWANNTFCKIFGYKPEEMEDSSTSTHFLSQEQYRQFTEEAYPVLASGETFSKSLQMIRRDGSLFHARFTGKAVNPENLFEGAIWILTDETVRMELEQELQRSHERFKQLAEIFPETIFEATEDGTITYVNKHGLEQFRYSEAEVANGANIFSMIAPEDRQNVHLRIKERLQGVTRDYLEYSALRADGSTFDAIGISVPVFEDAVLTGMRGFVLDITKRKLMEENLRKLSRAVEQSPVSIVITDLKGTIEFVNPVFTKLTGYTAEEAIGQNPRVLKSGQTPPEKYTALWAAVSEGKIWEGEFYNKSKDGHLFWEHAVISALRDEKGAITHYLAVKEDITEKKNIMEQLVIAKEQSDAASRAKSVFLSNMSHEIRTPMNGVIGMAQLLAMSELTADQKEYVEALKVSGNNLLSLINDILDLSKIEAGMITIEHYEFSLQKSLDDVLLTQKSVIFKKKLALNIDISSDIPAVVIGDQLRVKQIISNLLSNAIKFTTQGGITISSRILERHSSSLLVQIAVTDSGIGMSADVLEKIFTPFTQAESSTTRQFGGTGLGLSICRHLAELMGGSITVESTPGGGSCFKLTIPFAITQSVVTIAEPIPQVMYQWDGPKLKVLFVEDNPINITYSMALFAKLGLEAVLAENGRDCLAALEQSTFDLVLMDIQMPIMNGEEALREIRTKEQGTSLHQPVIALTAYSLRGDKERFLEEGFDGYVSKPMDIGELIDEMKRIVSIKGCEP